MSETSTSALYKYRDRIEKVIKSKDLYDSEVLALRKLSHPFIISVEKIHRASIVMKYYRNGDMYDYIKTGMPEYVVRHYGKQLIEALVYCHTIGISHRDVKPDNILLTDDWDIKLCDFGLSTTKHTETIYCGTADYACPEVLAKIPYSPMLADTWSYGATLYAMLMASLPWDGWRSSDKALDFISICLQKERPYLCMISDDPWLKYDEVKSYMSKIEI